MLAIRALGNLFAGFGSILSLLSFRVNVLRVFFGMLQMATGACYLLMFLVLLLFILRKPRSYTPALFVSLAGSCGLASLLLVLRTLFGAVQKLITGYTVSSASLVGVLGCLVVAGGVYCLLLAGGEKPLANVTADRIAALLQELPVAAGSIMGGFTANQKQRSADREARRREQEAARARTAAANGPAAGPQPQAPAYAGPAAYGPHMLKTDRSLVLYILLSLVTCGIYSLFFLHSLIQDVNVVCSGDGETTPGILKVILLSLITCGIYPLYWYYKLGNRLQNNAPRYGLYFSENGTSVLLWFLVGVLACGLGPLVGYHIILKNTNTLCAAYNRQFL